MLPLRKFQKNRLAHFRELDHILDFGYEVSRPGKGDGAGPSPLLKSPKFPKKRRPPRWNDSRHWVFGNIFDERRAAPPAYGRRAWSKVVSYLRFFIRFATLIRVQALPHQTNRSKIQKASLNYVGAVAEQLLWF